MLCTIVRDERGKEHLKNTRSMYIVEHEASTRETIKALNAADSNLLRLVLVGVFWRKRAPSSLPCLVNCLSADDRRIAKWAAEAIHKLAFYAVGQPSRICALERALDPHSIAKMIAYFTRTGNGQLALAFGFLHIRDAIPPLVDALESAGGSQRLVIVGALRMLKAVEAIPLLRHLVDRETNRRQRASLEYSLNTLEAIAAAQQQSL